MTKEVIVSIKGLQEMSAENGESVEMVSTGQYSYENNQPTSGSHRPPGPLGSPLVQGFSPSGHIPGLCP